MGKKKKPLDRSEAFRDLIVSVDRLAVAACHDRGTDAKLRAFLRAARAVAGELGVTVSDADLCQWVEFTPPVDVPTDGPDAVPGSRIVGDHLYRPYPVSPTQVLAVRKRPGPVDLWEVVIGSEDWGVSSRSGFQGYRWTPRTSIPNPFTSLEAAVEFVRTGFPDARKTRHLGA